MPIIGHYGYKVILGNLDEEWNTCSSFNGTTSIPHLISLVNNLDNNLIWMLLVINIQIRNSTFNFTNVDAMLAPFSLPVI